MAAGGVFASLERIVGKRRADTEVRPYDCQRRRATVSTRLEKRYVRLPA